MMGCRVEVFHTGDRVRLVVGLEGPGGGLVTTDAGVTLTPGEATELAAQVLTAAMTANTLAVVGGEQW